MSPALAERREEHLITAVDMCVNRHGLLEALDYSEKGMDFKRTQSWGP